MMIESRPSPAKSDEGLIVAVHALEEPDLLAGLEVHLVQEGVVALGRGADAGEIDPVLVLQDDPVAGLDVVMTGRPGSP